MRFVHKMADTTNIRVYQQTREKLLELQLKLQAKQGKRLSLDAVIKELLGKYTKVRKR